MKLDHEFEVPLGIDDAWQTMTNLELIALCLPGTALDEVVGDEYRGSVSVKVGPIGSKFVGTAHFTECDGDAHPR